MNEAEVETASDAAFFVANDVVNEYHAFPVVQRADVGGGNVLFINLNGEWYQFDVTKVASQKNIARLEELASNA